MIQNLDLHENCLLPHTSRQLNFPFPACTPIIQNLYLYYSCYTPPGKSIFPFPACIGIYNTKPVPILQLLRTSRQLNFPFPACIPIIQNQCLYYNCCTPPGNLISHFPPILFDSYQIIPDHSIARFPPILPGNCHTLPRNSIAHLPPILFSQGRQISRGIKVSRESFGGHRIQFIGFLLSQETQIVFFCFTCSH